MTAATHRLLLVEDSEPLGLQMVAALDGAGYETDWIRHGGDALAAVFDRYSLVILDLMLPGASGFEILAHLRRQGVRTPVLIASASADSRDKLRALDLGAIDYLAKPFWPQELLDRVGAHLARLESQPGSDAIEVGELAIDMVARRVRVDGDSVVLTRAEFEVLAALARRRGGAVPRAWLLEQMTDEGSGTSPRALDQCVSRVKEKLGRAGARIKPVWGVGYRLDA